MKGFPSFFKQTNLVTCGILVPRPGIKPSRPCTRGTVLTTGPAAKSLTPPPPFCKASHIWLITHSLHFWWHISLSLEFHRPHFGRHYLKQTNPTYCFILSKASLKTRTVPSSRPGMGNSFLWWCETDSLIHFQHVNSPFLRSLKVKTNKLPPPQK